MTTFKLALRSIRYYLPLAIIIALGVAVAAAVITASLITGSSFKASLSRYLNNRRGNINTVLQSSSLISYKLAENIPASAPVLALSAAGENANSSVIPDVKVYGITDKIKDQFNNSFTQLPTGRNIIINNSLANDLNIKVGDDIYFNFQKISDVNKSTLFADRNAYKNTVKLKFNVQNIIDDGGAGSFVISGSSLQPRIAYIDYTWLSKRLNADGKINLILSIDNYVTFQDNVKKVITDSDLGLSNKGKYIHYNGVLFPEEIVNKFGSSFTPVSTYLADELKFGNNSASYLMVSYNPYLAELNKIADDEVVLLKWVADDLKVKSGDKITMSYQRYSRNGTFTLEKIKLKVIAIVPNELPYLNKNFSPKVAGVTDVGTIGSWDAPFPFVSSRVTPRDEQYWKLYRAAPRAFVSQKVIKSIWQQEGNKDWVTTLINNNNQDISRIAKSIDFKNYGIFVIDYYAMINNASAGKTDMTSLLISTGIFIIASAVLFALLFMQLMVDYRKKQIGISLACGLDSKFVKKQFIIEGAIISFIGVIVGVFPGILLSYLLIEKFNTLWNISGSLKIYQYYELSDIIISAVAVFILMLAVIWYHIGKNIKDENIVSLIYNLTRKTENVSIKKQIFHYIFLILFIFTFILLYNNIMGRFLSAVFLLISLILFSQNYFSSFVSKYFNQSQIVNRLIQANLKRVLLIVIMISSSVFILMSTATFIKTDNLRKELSESSGFSCRIDFPAQPAFSLLSRQGRESAGISEDDEKVLKNVDFIPLYNNAGDDISCIAADKPTGVKIVGITKEFAEKSPERYDFSATESSHIWTDEETLYWSLKYMGGKGSIPVKDGRNYYFNSATAMLDSIFGSEVLISEADFKAMYPSITMPSIYMISIPGNDDAIIQLLRARLGPLGATVRKSSEILKSFHNVQNGYIEIFVNFSIIGLLLGILAHQAIIYRTVWEMRREIAIFNAIGLCIKEINSIFFRFIMAITLTGAVIGIASALVTVIPAISTNSRLISLLYSTLSVMIIYILSCSTIILAVKRIGKSNTIELLKSE